MGSHNERPTGGGSDQRLPFGMTHEERQQRFLESRERTVRVIQGQRFTPPTMEELLAAESCRLGVQFVVVEGRVKPEEEPKP